MKAKPTYLYALLILLLTAGLFTAWLSFRPASPEALAEGVAQNLSDELKVADEEVKPVLKTPFDIKRVIATKTTYAFFVYDRNRLRYWSDNSFVPPSQVLTDSFRTKLLRIGREAYVLRKNRIDENRFVISLITLVKEYPIHNDYLNLEWNKEVFPSPNFTILEPNASLGVPVCVEENTCVFRISFLTDDFPPATT